MSSHKSSLDQIYKIYESSVLAVGMGTPSMMTIPAPGMQSPTTVSPSAAYSEGEENEHMANVKKKLLILADKSIELFDCLCHCNELDAEQTAKLIIALDHIGDILDATKYSSSQQTHTDAEISVAPMVNNGI